MSKGELLMFGKLALTFLVLIGIPAWELYSLRRERSKPRTDEPGTGRPK